jgi:chromosome segregation ATPase
VWIDLLTTPWIVTALVTIVAALITTGLPVLASRAQEEHDQEIGRRRYEMELRDELRATVDRQRRDVAMLREEIAEMREETTLWRRRYEDCQQGRTTLEAEVRRLKREVQDMEGRMVRVEAGQRTGSRPKVKGG